MRQEDSLWTPGVEGGVGESLPVIGAILAVASRTRLLPRPEWPHGRRHGDSSTDQNNNEVARLGSEAMVAVQQRWQLSNFVDKFNEYSKPSSDA